MRGGLDDALEKLARRDELRRRAAGEATGTPPAVTELVEAIAAVVAHNPQLGVTVGVEGAGGDPLLLHFYFADGQVQVNAENAVAPSEAPAAGAPRHADIVIDTEEAADEPSSFAPPAGHQAPPSAYEASPYDAPTAYEPPGPYETPPATFDDQDRFGPPTFGYPDEERPYYADSDTAERRYGSFDAPPEQQYSPEPGSGSGDLGSRLRDSEPDPDARDFGARLRDLGMATSRPEYPPQFAPTTPPQSQAGPSMPPQPRSAVPPEQARTRRIQPEQHRAPAEPPAAERIPQPVAQHQANGGMPTPLPKPIPLQVERPEETEMAARRLAALLRDDPSLLSQPPE